MNQRTIKFRAWDKEGDSWYHPSPFTLREAMALQWIHKNPLADLVFMQFTGLLDAKGKEIYEGDILNIGERLFTMGWYAQRAAFWLFHSAPIETITRIASPGAPARDWNFLDGGRAVYWYNFDVERGDMSEAEARRKDTVELEIIGNIYENPDLLK